MKKFIAENWKTILLSVLASEATIWVVTLLEALWLG